MNNKKHLILLGAPGSGKGTQASMLSKKNGYLHISTGDLLRAESKKGTELGKKISKLIDQGLFVDDNTMIEMLQNNISLDNNCYIFDGFPRNLEQSTICSKTILKDRNQYQIIIFDLDINKLTNRLINRRACGHCNFIFNLLDTNTKATECPNCKSSDVIVRKDDNEDVIKKRFKLYEESIDKMIEFYSREGSNISRIDANQSQDQIYNQIIKVL
jgi:adenylate kinase